VGRPYTLNVAVVGPLASAAVVSISVENNTGAFCFVECSLTSGNPC